MMDESAIRARYEAAGQGHVLKYVDKLSDSSSLKDDLLRQLNDIRVEQIGGLLEAALAGTGASTSAGGGSEKEESHDQIITPFSKPVGQSTDPDVGSYYKKGLEAIANDQVAALVLAGGQGTRLGFDGPKGMYDIGMPSGRTLFQLLCERLQRLQTIAPSSSGGSTIPFYIMTSPINHDETVQFFQDNSFFGLSENNVKFFQQGMLPCLTEDGKIIMETSSKVSMAPDGCVHLHKLQMDGYSLVLYNTFTLTH